MKTCRMIVWPIGNRSTRIFNDVDPTAMENTGKEWQKEKLPPLPPVSCGHAPADLLFRRCKKTVASRLKTIIFY